jgi:CRISPR-associated protein Csh1
MYQIGKEISAGRDPWEDILSPAKVSESEWEKKKLYVLGIDLNLDEQQVIVSTENLTEYSEHVSALKAWRSIKIQGGNNKAIYICVDAKKPEQLAKTLFGKPDKDGNYPAHGEFIEAIDKDFAQFQDTDLYSALQSVAPLAKHFHTLLTDEKGKTSTKNIEEALSLGSLDRLVLIYATITDSKNDWQQKPFGALDGYVDFVEAKFFPKAPTTEQLTEKLCYATGNLAEDIREAEFSGRYNINKFFVKTTRNYAGGFDPKNFEKNYQLSAQSELFLDRGSSYLLGHATTDIADIRHVVIPEFFQQEELEAEEIRPFVKRADLLFKHQNWKNLINYLEDNAEINGLYWLNFIAIDSDGNYFKVGNAIKDVSKLHFQQIFESIKELNEMFGTWLNPRTGFNLYSFYKSVPVRKDKENINVALHLLSALLEQRTIDRDHIFRHFADLALCHRFERYRSFTNIFPQSNFDFALRDAVVQYQAFIRLLSQLNQISLPLKTTPMSEPQTIDQEERAFLEKLDYTEDQTALFYLGRALSRIVQEQSKKGHKKNMLDKLNYNGMDRRAVYELASSIMEAGRHYLISNNIEWPLDSFYRRFNFNKWKMDSREALFFILSGYTYKIRRKPEEGSAEAEG